MWWWTNPNGFVGEDRDEGDYEEKEVRRRFWDENWFQVAVRFV